MKNKKFYRYLFMILILVLVSINKISFGYKNDDNIIVDNNLLTVHFIDVGQGDSTFIELGNNKTMLIDAGEKESFDKINNYIKTLGYSKIDYVIGTHPHSDHIGGLTDIINNYEINNIYLPKVSTNTNTYLNLLKTIKNNNLKINAAKKNIKIIDDDNLKIEILSPIKDKYNNLNNYSIVTKLTYYNNTFLFMGDAEKEVENDLVSNYINLKADVLKTGHHGSSTSSTFQFLNKVQPKYSIISCGINNKYNHPNKIVLDNLNKIGSKTYRTDLNGDIILTSDGNNIKVNTSK